MARECYALARTGTVKALSVSALEAICEAVRGRESKYRNQP